MDFFLKLSLKPDYAAAAGRPRCARTARNGEKSSATEFRPELRSGLGCHLGNFGGKGFFGRDLEFSHFCWPRNSCGKSKELDIPKVENGEKSSATEFRPELRGGLGRHLGNFGGQGFLGRDLEFSQFFCWPRGNFAAVKNPR